MASRAHSTTTAAAAAVCEVMLCSAGVPTVAFEMELDVLKHAANTASNYCKIQAV